MITHTAEFRFWGYPSETALFQRDELPETSFEALILPFAKNHIGHLAHTFFMFREAMSKGKTRVTIEISDCNLLRMRLLMLLERPKRDRKSVV